MNDTTIENALDTLSRGADALISREELRAKLQTAQSEKRPLKVKLGLDPTAPDIHLGFAVVLRKLRQFQDLGHQAHLIIGDFTAQIGDPSGKSKTRPPLSHAQVLENAQTYKEQLFKVLDESKTTIHFNGHWLGKMGFADVVKLASKMTVAQMLEREDFARRLEEKRPIALHELLYPLCQGQDSVEIEADVELGGTDQRFNNLVGRDLQRANGKAAQVVMLMPILVGLDGTQKMSKSLGNYVGISEAPPEMFGKLMSLPDEGMRQYFVLCTLVALEEIEEVLNGHPMDAKKRLGREIVAIYHGDEAAQGAQKAFEDLFSDKKIPDEMAEFEVAGGEIALWELLKLVFAVSGKEAKRLIVAGAVSVEGEKISDGDAVLNVKDGMVLKKGKRDWVRLRVGE